MNAAATLPTSSLVICVCGVCAGVIRRTFLLEPDPNTKEIALGRNCDVHASLHSGQAVVAFRLSGAALRSDVQPSGLLDDIRQAVRRELPPSPNAHELVSGRERLRAVPTEEPPPPPWSSFSPTPRVSLTQPSAATIATSLLCAWTQGKGAECDDISVERAVSVARQILYLTKGD